MSVPITTIQGSDNVGLSRLTINTNFAALKAASDAVTALLDPTTFTLTGIKSIVIDDAAASLSSAILSVSKGASILGNVTMGTVGQSTTVLINGNGGVSLSAASLTLGLGDLNLSSSSSQLKLNGAISIGGEKRVPGVASAFLNTVGLTATTTTAVPVSASKYVVVSNGSTASSATYGLTASLNPGATGQEVQVYHVAGPSGPVRIDASNFVGLTGAIVMTKTGDKLTCIYEGTSWYLWDFTQGGTASITLNRI